MSCAIKRDWLAVWQVNLLIDPGGTSRLDVLIGSGARVEAVSFGMAKGACLSVRAEMEESGGDSGA
jgi:hypothetical protein